MRWVCVILFSAIFATRSFARGGGGCFAAGTPIAAPGGDVPIETLRAGDAVYAEGPAGRIVAHVAATYAVAPDHFLRLDLGDVRIDVTDEHPFAIAAGTFIEARRLRAGDSVLRQVDGRLQPVSIRSVETIPSTKPAYNLTVASAENFFASGVLVHNKGCFLADTPILRPDGSSTSIASLKPGDAVLAFDENQNPVQATVREVIAIDVDGHLSITTDRVTLEVTAEHPFYVGDGIFREAQTLKPGDFVFAFDGKGLSPQTVRSVHNVPGVVRVYNLHTDNPHTFFAAGIAVHNKGGGGGGGGGHGGGFSGGGHYYGGGGSGRGSSPWFCSITGMLVLFGLPIFMLIKRLGQLADGRGSGGGTELDYVHPVAAVRPRADATERLLASLATTDPSAAPGRLRLMVRETFLQLQQCWQSRDYESMRPLLTPELFSQHLRQLQAMKDHHEINRIDGIRIESIDLVHLGQWSRSHEVEFTALITAAASDYYIDDRTNAFLRGDRTTARFQEFWTFRHQGNLWLLRQIEQSRESRKLVEPNDIGGVDQTTGPAGPWSDRSAGDAASTATTLLRKWEASDPTWNMSRLVDRVSAVFTSAMLAQQGDGRERTSGDDVFPSMASEIAAAVSRDQSVGQVTEFRNFDVRHVDIVIVRRFMNRTRDQFVARVAAHAQTVTTKAGRVVRQDPDVVAFIRYAVMGRSGDRWKLQQILAERDAKVVLSSGNLDGG